MKLPRDLIRNWIAELVRKLKNCKKTWTVLCAEVAQMFQGSQKKGKKDINIERTQNRLFRNNARYYAGRLSFCNTMLTDGVKE